MEAFNFQMQLIGGTRSQFREDSLTVGQTLLLGISVSISTYHGQQGLVDISDHFNCQLIFKAVDFHAVNRQKVIVVIIVVNTATQKADYQNNDKHSDPGTALLSGLNIIFLVFLFVVLIRFDFNGGGGLFGPLGKERFALLYGSGRIFFVFIIVLVIVLIVVIILVLIIVLVLIVIVVVFIVVFNIGFRQTYIDGLGCDHAFGGIMGNQIVCLIQHGGNFLGHDVAVNTLGAFNAGDGFVSRGNDGSSNDGGSGRIAGQ